ncbi:MAG: A/G-specific adenine glycosylase [Sphingobacteriales bacterium]|nr:A/G-specific adenine glycosylase [Sphingobacteriales bacterium]
MPKSDYSLIRKAFPGLLLKWDKTQNTRQMPWKGEKDPYKIWVSEIILQQTRVAQGLDYYNKFIDAFPNVHKLAKASEAKVFKLWEGLGYYSRCRNLIASAKYISRELKGRFPDNYEAIKQLKGVGPYTAAAIASFAYNLPHAVVDGNVFRLLSRVFGINKPVDSTNGKKYFTQLAQELLDKQYPGKYNQAIMDFGAEVCKPAAPLCSSCVLNRHCSAFLNKKVNELPVKEKKIVVKKRCFYYLLLEYKNTIAIRKRIGKDIWHSLYEFLLIETKRLATERNILQQGEKNNWLPKDKYEVISTSPVFTQPLSHQLITGRFLKIRLKKKPSLQKSCLWIDSNELRRYSFPAFINTYLKQDSAV